MSDSYLDHIPSREREKIRKRMRSPEAYEKLRERVKGPEDLEREMEKNEKMAELSFALETEPKVHNAVKSQVEKDLKEQGGDAVLETVPSTDEGKRALEQGKFILKVSSHPRTHQDQLMVVPEGPALSGDEGKVQEKLPVKPSFSDTYSSQLAA